MLVVAFFYNDSHEEKDPDKRPDNALDSTCADVEK